MNVQLDVEMSPAASVMNAALGWLKIWKGSGTVSKGNV